MTLLEAIDEAKLRADAFRREETDARAHLDELRAERCRQAAITLEELIRWCDERLLREIAW